MAIRILLVVCMLAVSACGWQLRSATDRVEIDRLTLLGATPEFRLPLEQSLEDDGVIIHDMAPHMLKMSAPEWQSRTVALDRFGRAAEIELRVKLVWQILDHKDAIVVPRQVISTSRRYQVSADNVAGASDEDRLARDDMQAEMILRIMRALSKLAPTLESPE